MSFSKLFYISVKIEILWHICSCEWRSQVSASPPRPLQMGWLFSVQLFISCETPFLPPLCYVTNKSHFEPFFFYGFTEVVCPADIKWQNIFWQHQDHHTWYFCAIFSCKIHTCTAVQVPSWDDEYTLPFSKPIHAFFYLSILIELDLYSIPSIYSIYLSSIFASSFSRLYLKLAFYLPLYHLSSYLQVIDSSIFLSS